MKIGLKNSFVTNIKLVDKNLSINTLSFEENRSKVIFLEGSDKKLEIDSNGNVEIFSDVKNVAIFMYKLSKKVKELHDINRSAYLEIIFPSQDQVFTIHHPAKLFFNSIDQTILNSINESLKILNKFNVID